MSFCLLPAFYVCAALRHHVFREYRVAPLPPLPHVVVEEEKNLGRKLDNGCKIDESHYAHGEVDDAPCLLQGDECSSHDGGSCDDAEKVDIRLLLCDEAYVGLTVEVVGDDGAVGEEEYGCSDEESASLSYVGLKCIFGEDDAVSSAVVDAREKDDEGCAGAHDDGVGEDSESLEQTLLDRVGRVGDGCCVGRAAFASLIAEESSLDSLCHCYANSSSCC